LRIIQILDTSLRDGEQAPGYSMSLAEKIQLSRQLARLGVDAIEAGFPVASPEDFTAVKHIAGEITSSAVVALARTRKEDIDRAWEAIKEARYPRLHLFLATSPIHMQYKLNMSPESVVSRVKEAVAYAKSLCPEVEFSAEDATRSERDFLSRVFRTALDAGATIINMADTVGYAMPEEIASLIYYLKEHTPGLDQALLSVHCHNDLGLAAANTLAAIKAGAQQVECTINAIGERAGNAALEEIVMALKTRPDSFAADTRINTREIYRTSKLLSTITGLSLPPNKPIVGTNAFAHESGIHQHGVLQAKSTYEIMTPESIGILQNTMILGKHSGKHALEDRLSALGYELSEKDLARTFTNFKLLAEKKRNISDQDIIALANTEQIAVPKTYTLKQFVVNSGTAITATANLELVKDQETLQTVAVGSGPIDAAFTAIENVAQTGASLEKYTINSVTEGEDALGEVIVSLSCGGRRFTGRGLSTDIIEASIKAYLNGVNKIIAHFTPIV